MRYLFSYDLRKPGQDYKKLYDELERMDAVRVLASQWVIRRFNTTCVGLRDHYKQFVDENDGLLFVEIDGDGWAGWSLTNKISEIPKEA